MRPDDWRKLGRSLMKTLREVLNNKMRKIKKIPNRGTEILSNWHLAQLPKNVKLSELNGILDSNNDISKI